MIASIGCALLSISIICSVFLCLSNRYHKLQLFSSILFYSSVASNIVSFLTLVYAFIVSDFSLETVLFNSSTIKPLIYKISAAYASHEGSLLFLLALCSLVSGVIHYRIDSDIRKVFAGHYGFVIILFLSYVLFASNPFALSKISNMGVEIKEGLGLNPILQDIGISIHPPILYLGHSLYFSIFLLGLSASNIENQAKLQSMILSTSKAAWGVITCGIALGSWWAYRELGWGGYWFFDPVENISLMPWLLGAALHHSLIASYGSKKPDAWSSILTLLVFPSIVFGAFLVRSGLITSVHSFASTELQGLYILGIFTLLIFYAFLSYFQRKTFFPSFAHNQSIIVGNILWMILFTLIIFGCTAPVIYYQLFDNQLISINENYYYTSFIPVCTITLLAAAYYAFRFKKILKFLLFIVAIFITSLILPKHSMLIFSSCSAGIYLALSSCYYLLYKIRTHQDLYPKVLSSFLGHFGFALLAISISINVAYQKEVIFDNAYGERQNLMGYEVSLQNVFHSTGSNYVRKIIELWLEDDKGVITKLKPELKLYQIEGQLLPDSDIYSYLTHDLYAVISEVENENIRVTLYLRPAISFIWFSILLMCSGLFISFIFKEESL